jgi:hypothetical protein
MAVIDFGLLSFDRILKNRSRIPMIPAPPNILFPQAQARELHTSPGQL